MVEDELGTDHLSERGPEIYLLSPEILTERGGGIWPTPAEKEAARADLLPTAFRRSLFFLLAEVSFASTLTS